MGFDGIKDRPKLWPEVLLGVMGLTFFALANPKIARAESTFYGKGEVWLQGDYREYPNRGFAPDDSALEGIGRIQYQMRWTNPYFRIEVSPEIRGFQSKVLEYSPLNAGYATVASPKRLLQLEKKIADSRQTEVLFDLERLNYISYFGLLEMQIGRKPVSVGTLKVIPIWNKFSRPLPNNAGPNFVFGQDSFILRWQKDLTSFQLIDIEGNRFRQRDSVRWLEGIYYHPEIELHWMAAHWWKNTTTGFALAKDLWGATLRSEGLWIDLDNKQKNRELQLGLGVEYAWSEIWTLLGEAVFYERGASKKADYPLELQSPFRPLRAKAYAYLQANAKFWSFWEFNLAAMVNGVDGSFYPMVKLGRSVSDNWEIAWESRFPIGADQSEFSKTTFAYPKLAPGFSVGAPSQHALTLTGAF